MDSYRKYIFNPTNHSNDVTHPYPELEKMIMDYLNPFETYRLILLNRYYHKTIGADKVYLEFRKFYVKRRHLLRMPWYFDKQIMNDDARQFINACRFGYVNIVHYLRNGMEKKYIAMRAARNFPITIERIYNLAFVCGCENGHIEITKWLLSISKINLHYNGELPFRLSCARGHLETAQFLYQSSLKDNNKIDIHVVYDAAFREACEGGHSNVAEWLCTLCDKYKITYVQKAPRDIVHKVIFV